MSLSFSLSSSKHLEFSSAWTIARIDNYRPSGFGLKITFHLSTIRQNISNMKYLNHTFFKLYLRAHKGARSIFMKVVKILVCLEWWRVCIVLPALLNTARIILIPAREMRKTSKWRWPLNSTLSFFTFCLYNVSRLSRAFSRLSKSFYDFFRSDSLIEYHNISSIFSSAHSCSG